MKKSEIKVLREKNIEDLKKLFSVKKKEINKVMIEVSSGTEKNLKKIRFLRRDIAQILTIIRQKDILNIDFPQKQK